MTVYKPIPGVELFILYVSALGALAAMAVIVGGG